MTSLTPPGLSVPVGRCAPWCTSTEARHQQEHPSDRLCWSEFHVVPLTLHEPVDYGTPGNRWGYDKLDVVLRRGTHDCEVLISHEAGCARCDSDHETRFTLEETQALRDKLTELLELAGS